MAILHRYVEFEVKSLKMYRNRFNDDADRPDSRERRNARRKGRSKYRFIRHLVVYLAVNMFVISSSIRHGGDWSWYPMTLFWGIGVFFHYLKAFGFPREEIRSKRGYLSLSGPSEGADDLELKPMEKRWSEKDLV